MFLFNRTARLREAGWSFACDPYDRFYLKTDVLGTWRVNRKITYMTRPRTAWFIISACPTYWLAVVVVLNFRNEMESKIKQLTTNTQGFAVQKKVGLWIS